MNRILLLCILCIGMADAAAPVLYSLRSGISDARGPVWLTFKTSDLDADVLTISMLNVSYLSGNEVKKIDVNDATLQALEFQALNSAKDFSFLWNIPQVLIDQDEIDLNFELQVKDATDQLSNVITLTEHAVPFKELREKHWKRTPGFQESVATFSPGSYIKFAFEGAGLIAQFGEAINMGKVEISRDGTVLPLSPIDFYPANIPANATPNIVVDTRFIKKRLFDTEKANKTIEVQFTLLAEKNVKAVDTGMVLTSLSIDQYLDNKVTVISRDVFPTSNNIKLYSVPSPFDISLFLPQLDFISGLTVKNKASLPSDAIAYRVQYGPSLDGLKTQNLLLDEQFDSSHWLLNQPYHFSVRAINELGLESLAMVDRIVFKLENAISSQKGKAQTFSIDGQQIEFEVSSEQPFVWTTFENENRFPKFSERAQVFVLQDPSSFDDVSLILKNLPSSRVLHQYDQASKKWTPLDLSENLSIEKASLFVFENQNASDESLSSSHSSGGGGCFIK